MIRGLFRFVGMLLLAGAFVFLVYDGQRSIADQSLRVMKLGEFWNDMNQASQQSARAAIEALVPGLWDAGTFLVAGGATAGAAAAAGPAALGEYGVIVISLPLFLLGLFETY